MIDVLPRWAVEDGEAAGADAIVSIRASAIGDDAPLDAAIARSLDAGRGRLLVLRVDDIGAASVLDALRPPTLADVMAALDFGTAVGTGGRLVVHGEHGVSRSPGDRHGPGGEERAVAELLERDPGGRLHSNPVIVEAADRLLARDGALITALEAACPRFRKWRSFWRTVQDAPSASEKKAAATVRRLLGARRSRPREHAGRHLHRRPRP